MTPPKEVPFADIVREENIVCYLSATSRDESIAELAGVLHKHEEAFDLEAAIAASLERERVSSTIIAEGLALPHARLNGLNHPIVAIGTSVEGIDFLDPEDGFIHIVILVLTPPSDPSAYLRVVAAISNSLGSPEMRRRVMACSSPGEMHGVLTENIDELPSILSARDLMNRKPVVVLESDTLATVLDAFCRRRTPDLAVVDEEGDVRGMLSLEDVLRLSLPKHLLWMEDLRSISNFEPFAELLKKESETKVADFMREDYVSIEPDAPAIQLAKLFLINDVRQILVLDGIHLEGTVSLRRFVAQLFWA